MSATLSIGDFSRGTNLSVKALRYYHRVGLLDPAGVDARTGYRRYRVEQIPVAQIIRRFRDLDMPVDEVLAVLAAPDVEHRNALIAAHLSRLEQGLAHTQAAVASLRDLLGPSTELSIQHRGVPATPSAAISETVAVADLWLWLQGAMAELQATVQAQPLTIAVGRPGAVYGDRLFTDGRGPATIFLPCTGNVRPVGRVAPALIPASELAIIEHAGPHDDVDRAYGALATYVSQHALAVDGPLREYYPVSHLDTPDESRWRTEIGWPIFNTTT